jgi:tRNA A-37 threonylcarbamoyl transferase component Bud32
MFTRSGRPAHCGGCDYNGRKSASLRKLPPLVDSDFKQLEQKLEHIEKEFHDLHYEAKCRELRLNEILNLLQQVDAISIDEEQRCGLHHCFAMTYAKLGDYTAAISHYHEVIPYVYFKLSDLDFNDADQFCARLKNDFRAHHLSMLLHYFKLAIEMGQNLEVTERILGILPRLITLAGRGPLINSEQQRVTFLTIQASNARHNYEEAFKHLCEYNVMPEPSSDYLNSVLESGLVTLEKAKLCATKDPPMFKDMARKSFVYSLAISTIYGGIWHENTLEGLYQFGIALMRWGEQEASLRVLRECCLGACYRFGWNHPYFIKARRELKSCDGSASVIRALERYKSLEDKEQSSIMKEHVFVNTIIDVLWYVPDVDFVVLEDALVRDFGSESEGGPVMSRILASCMEQRGDFRGALDMIKTNPGFSEKWEDVVLRLDKIRIVSRLQDSGTDAASDEAKVLLYEIGSRPHDPSDQGMLMAVRRRLGALGVTHFTPQQPSAQLALVGEQNIALLGTGTYARVHSVKFGHELYARKTIALPRFRQQQVREAIQNELAVTRMLVHPHIISVFFTYEENACFYIVMDPVADYDLETFLIQHSAMPPTQSQRDTILDWFCCLANTLAFIHSKGVRHKDIKPRNILVKGKDVIFADFGSSHAFAEEGGSTTEGPSHGHTKMYCAPEVISQGKRNRTTDVFSLGCVFTELAVWLAGCPIHSWHEYRTTEIDHMETNAYYASLDKVALWFRSCAEERVRLIYNHVIRRMLHPDPGERLKTVQVNRLVTKIRKTDNWEIESCSRCGLELWLDAPKNAIA